jgi:hypothetical protein
VSVGLPERGSGAPLNSVNSVREGRPEMGRAVEFLWKATGGFEPMIRDLNPVFVNIFSKRSWIFAFPARETVCRIAL